MLKRRLIPVLYIKNGFIVRSEKFEEHKIIGNVVNTVRRFNEWDIDELVYIDISREKKYDSKRDDHKIGRVTSIFDILDLVSKECFMPLTFGGGIRDYQTIRSYLTNGADKVLVNTMLHENPDDVRKAVKTYGSQAIVASLDYRIENGEIALYSNFGKKKLDLSFEEASMLIDGLGCGEVFITSIDRDGTGEGYDIETAKMASSLFRKPVIVCGGAMNTFDFEELAEVSGISGLAAGNMFHFTENIYPRSKKKLKSCDLNFR